MDNPTNKRHRNHTGLCPTCRGPLQLKGTTGQRYCPPCYNHKRRQQRTVNGCEQQAYEEVFGFRRYARGWQPKEVWDARRKWTEIAVKHGHTLAQAELAGEVTGTNPDEPPDKLWSRYGKKPDRPQNPYADYTQLGD